MIGKRSVNELQVTGSNPLQVIKYVLQFTWYDPIAWFQVLPDLSSSRAVISWRAGQLKTELAGCVNYSATPQASLAVSDEVCWPNMAEASLSCCQFSSIHLLSKDSEHSPQPRTTQQLQATLRCPDFNPDNGQGSDFHCCKVYFLCYICCALLSNILPDIGFDPHCTSSSPSPPVCSVVSQLWWCHKSEVRGAGLPQYLPTTTSQIPVVATSSLHPDINGIHWGSYRSKHRDVQGIQRY